MIPQSICSRLMCDFPGFVCIEETETFVRLSNLSSNQYGYVEVTATLDERSGVWVVGTEECVGECAICHPRQYEYWLMHDTWRVTSPEAAHEPFIVV